MWVENPDDFNRQVTREQWEAQVYRCARRIPTLPIPEEMKGVVDLYDCSDDWIPIYDKSDLGGFYMAVGTSGNQFKNGPVVGHCMAELIDAVEKGHDHDSDPVKVTARYTGVELDMGVLLAPARDQREQLVLGQWLASRPGCTCAGAPRRSSTTRPRSARWCCTGTSTRTSPARSSRSSAIGDAVFWVADDADHSPDFLGGGTARFILEVDPTP